MVRDISFSEADVSNDISESIVRFHRVSGTSKKIARKLSPEMMAQSHANQRQPRPIHRYLKVILSWKVCLTLYDEACHKRSDGITTVQEDDVYSHFGPSLVQIKYVLLSLAGRWSIINLNLR